MAEEKKKALGMAILQIEKNYGKGSIMKMGDVPKLSIDAIPTGSLALDLALGVGGLPRGRIIEIYGPEGGGKTTLTLHAIAEAQKKGGTAAFIDAEHAMDPVYAKRLGVDIDNLLISQPDYGEQALEITETLVRSGAVDIIVIDSVAALVPRAEVEGDMGDAQVGRQARLMSQALRKLTAAIGKSKTLVIFINQLREKVGIMFGNPETTPGGRALKFYSSVRLDVRAKEKIKEGEVIVGTRIKTKVVKNKVAPPFREATFILVHGQGISRVLDIIDIGSHLGVIIKTGAWYSFEEQKLGQGIEASKKYLEDNKNILDKIEKRINKIIAENHPGADQIKKEAREETKSKAKKKV
ncbi:MAG: recombinase RecA [bacterium]